MTKADVRWRLRRARAQERAMIRKAIEREIATWEPDVRAGGETLLRVIAALPAVDSGGIAPVA